MLSQHKMPPYIVYYLQSQPPSINCNHFAGNVRRSPTRQPNHHTTKVLRRSPPPHRYPLDNLLARLPLLQVPIQIRCDVARCYSVNPYAFRRPVIRHTLRQLRHTTLTRRIRRSMVPALKRLQASNRDDSSAVSALVGRLGQEVGAEVAG